MPICKKCNNQFPNRIVIDGKSKTLQNRSNCLECSPWGEKLGPSLRKENQKPKKCTKNCVICEREYPTNKNNVCSSCRSLYRRRQNKLKAIDQLGGVCFKCKESDPRVLTFHHTLPSEKKFELSTAWSSKSWAEVQKELSSCELLCSNCHFKEHSNNDERLQKICKYYENGYPV